MEKECLASIQMKGNRIKYLNIENGFITLSLDDVEVKEFSVDSTALELEQSNDTENSYTGVEELTVSICLQKEKRGMKIQLTIEAGFDITASTKEEAFELMDLNGSTAMFSIARSLVLTFTAQTYIGKPLILPMINMIALKQRKKNQEQV